ncbi:hypothetical protein PUN28_001033 [Cardiocondyla obscurior]|uniref:Uncharacterized protein n=1 Tax=Cardiocondyla obscurior TaxID=286306 RepID=A0AAW2H305_9HYME
MHYYQCVISSYYYREEFCCISYSDHFRDDETERPSIIVVATQKIDINNLWLAKAVPACRIIVC